MDTNKPPGSRYELEANPRKPKDKPLRIKRGHRKSAVNDAEANKTGTSFKEPGSPASESQSHRPESQPKGGAKSAANGVGKPPKNARSAFELYSAERRLAIEAKDKDKDKDDDGNADEELARGWEELSESARDEFRRKFEEQQQGQQARDAKDTGGSDNKGDGADGADGDDKRETQDDDIEMINYDTEDQETQLD